MNANTATDDLALARKPLQARSRKRFEAILAEAERLLESEGLQGFSIPSIAENLGFNRRTIYALFPTPYAVLNELTRRHVIALEQELIQHAATLDARPEVIIARYVCIASNYHNRNPAGRLLILGGAVSDQSFRAQELTTHRLGQMGGLLIRAAGVILPPGPPDIPVVAVELGVACMRISYSAYGYVKREYAIEAAFAMLVYLSARVPGAIGEIDRAMIEGVADELLEARRR